MWEVLFGKAPPTRFYQIKKEETFIIKVSSCKFYLSFFM